MRSRVRFLSLLVFLFFFGTGPPSYILSIVDEQRLRCYTGGVVHQRWTRFILHPGNNSDREKLILFANTESRQMLSMKQGSIIKGWGCNRISLFIHCRLNITCGTNILTLPDSYEAQRSEYYSIFSQTVCR